MQYVIRHLYPGTCYLYSSLSASSSIIIVAIWSLPISTTHSLWGLINLMFLGAEFKSFRLNSSRRRSLSDINEHNNLRGFIASSYVLLLDINMLRSLDYMMPGQQGELTGTFERRHKIPRHLVVISVTISWQLSIAYLISNVKQLILWLKCYYKPYLYLALIVFDIR